MLFIAGENAVLGECGRIAEAILRLGVVFDIGRDEEIEFCTRERNEIDALGVAEVPGAGACRRHSDVF